MRIYFKIFGWVLVIPSFIVYIILWIEAFKFISQKIGSFFSIILLFLTNIICPAIYIIWNWIEGNFPTTYFFIWLGAIVVFRIGWEIKLAANEE